MTKLIKPLIMVLIFIASFVFLFFDVQISIFLMLWNISVELDEIRMRLQ